MFCTGALIKVPIQPPTIQVNILIFLKNKTKGRHARCWCRRMPLGIFNLETMLDFLCNVNLITVRHNFGTTCNYEITQVFKLIILGLFSFCFVRITLFRNYVGSYYIWLIFIYVSWTWFRHKLFKGSITIEINKGKSRPPT